MDKGSIDNFFARNTDYKVCSYCVKALDDLISNGGIVPNDAWPHSWKVAWIVLTYQGVWEGDGIGALWHSDLDHITMFIQYLTEIDEPFAANVVADSIDEIGADKILSDDFYTDEEFAKMTKKWDDNINLYTEFIGEKLAKYVRLRRYEFAPIFDLMVEHERKSD